MSQEVVPSLSTRVINAVEKFGKESYWALNLKLTVIELVLDGKVRPTFLEDLETLAKAAEQNRMNLEAIK